MTVEEVFAKIKAHQIEGTMFHDQMRQYFDFLNLKGFKRMHEHHYKEESDSLVKTDSFYMRHANSFIPEYSVSTQSYIPQNWRQTRCRCHHKAQSRKGRNGKVGGMGTPD